MTPAPRKNPKEEGAVMLAVMLLLLMSTVTGLVALQSSTFELRAVGSERRVQLTHYIAEGALTATLAHVDAVGARTVRIVMSHAPVASATRIANEEPATGREITNYRLTMSDYATAVGASGPILETSTTVGASVGPGLGVVPDFTVDVNDDYIVSRPIAGARSDGYGELRYMMATYTARGRTRPYSDVDANGTLLGAAGGGLARGLHESAANARAYAISGPFPWED